MTYGHTVNDNTLIKTIKVPRLETVENVPYEFTTTTKAVRASEDCTFCPLKKKLSFWSLLDDSVQMFMVKYGHVDPR